MTKKSFKDNPALQFISIPDAVPQEDPAPRQAVTKAPAGHRINPLYVETKSRRVQLVLQPSLHERVKSNAAAAGLSLNEYVHQLLDAATNKEQ